jgi:hypothetical protein
MRKKGCDPAPRVNILICAIVIFDRQLNSKRGRHRKQTDRRGEKQKMEEEA